MTYAIKNKKGKYLRAPAYVGNGFWKGRRFGPLDPAQTVVFTSKREACALAEFHGDEVVEVVLKEAR